MIRQIPAIVRSNDTEMDQNEAPELLTIRSLEQKLGRKPVVGIVSMSPIADDPRVRRQGDTFHEFGWDVRGFGLQSRVSDPPPWAIDSPEDAGRLPEKPTMPETQYVTFGVRRIPIRLLQLAEHYAASYNRHEAAYELRLLKVFFDPGLAERIYWTLNGSFWDLLALARLFKADLWLGNDWTSLPIVARLAREQGVPYVYDTHEFAAEEFNEDKTWRFIQRPIRVETERSFIRDAAVVSTVSEGIALRLQKIYGLHDVPLTVRSTPNYQAVSFRPTGERIRVLYHGMVWEHRGLEECIRSVASWRPEFDLTIRGLVSDAYRAILESEIDTAGVRGRVHIVPPVPMLDLVREAAAFDIGLFALPGHSAHNQNALPNKFFEYTMAGLALCMSDLPEMAALIELHRHGIIFSGLEQASISTAINSLTRERIDEMKHNSLKAAKDLCWERERNRMLVAYAEVISRQG